MTQQVAGRAAVAGMLTLLLFLFAGLVSARERHGDRGHARAEALDARPAERHDPPAGGPGATAPGRAAGESPHAPVRPFDAVLSGAKPSGSPLDIPTGVEYPIKVQLAVWVNSISKIDEVEGSFTAEVDVRVTWNDSRLGSDLKALGLDRQEFGFDEAPAKLATIWTPQIAIWNLDSKSTTEERVALIIYARGAVEVLRRINTRFKSSFDFTRFPFDSQALSLEIRSLKYGAAQVVFAHGADERHQSGVKAGISIPNWTFEPRIGVHLATRRGWTGRDHSFAIAQITARRETGQYFFQIFLPFFTIMLFPPLALWVPKADVMPRANMTFNGLFSLIGFSYSIFIRYPMLAAVDNVIVRMLYVAYIFLAAVLCMIMTVHNPNFTSLFSGKHLWAEAAAWTTWSVPLLFVLAIGSMILFSM